MATPARHQEFERLYRTHRDEIQRFVARGVGDREEAEDVTQEFRFTVEASLLGALIGAGLIVLVIAGLYWVFRRYGRR
jgi:uncharacterized membrane protein